ncbi:MAG: MFS transporter [Bdellovibrionales bacterium]
MNASHSLSSNIWKLYADRLIANFYIFAPLLVPYYQASGLNATEVFVIQAVYSAALCLLEIPTGYISDLWGRKKTLVAASIILPTGILIYVLFPCFWGFIAAEIVIALGNSLRSGTDSSLLYDTLRELKRENEHKKIEGNGHFLKQFSSAVAAILGGLIATISLNAPFYVSAAVFAMLLPLTLIMREPARTKTERKTIPKHLRNMAKAVHNAAQDPKIRALAVYSAFITATSLAGFWSYFLLYGKMGLGVEHFGLLTAGCGICCGLGGHFAHAIEKRVGQRAAYALPMLIAPGFFAIAALQNLWAIPFILLNEFLWGYFTPLKLDMVHRNAPTSRRATTLSAISVAERLTFVILSVAAGRLVDLADLRYTHVFLGAVMLAAGAWAVTAMKPKT